MLLQGLKLDMRASFLKLKNEVVFRDSFVLISIFEDGREAFKGNFKNCSIMNLQYVWKAMGDLVFPVSIKDILTVALMLNIDKQIQNLLPYFVLPRLY